MKKRGFIGGITLAVVIVVALLKIIVTLLNIFTLVCFYIKIILLC